jgi:hypothetical protein
VQQRSQAGWIGGQKWEAIFERALWHGRGEGEDRAAAEETYRKVRELMARFEARHGSCICRTLLGGCDLGTTEGQRIFKERDLLNRACAPAVRTVVEALEEML